MYKQYALGKSLNLGMPSVFTRWNERLLAAAVTNRASHQSQSVCPSYGLHCKEHLQMNYTYAVDVYSICKLQRWIVSIQPF